MTNEEMKVLKFKTMVDEIYKHIRTRTNVYEDNGKYIEGAEVLLGNSDLNLYWKVICKQSSTCSNACNAVVCLLSSKSFPKSTIENLIEGYIKCCGCSSQWKDCDTSGRTIFFSLMILAIDEKAYDEKLETVSDAAYMMGFNEEMIEDWITVVKKFLMAEEIDREQLKTEEAKKFFEFFDYIY